MYDLSGQGGSNADLLNNICSACTDQWCGFIFINTHMPFIITRKKKEMYLLIHQVEICGLSFSLNTNFSSTMIITYCTMVVHESLP